MTRSPPTERLNWTDEQLCSALALRASRRRRGGAGARGFAQINILCLMAKRADFIRAPLGCASVVVVGVCPTANPCGL
jgi:hypothetical protein